MKSIKSISIIHHIDQDPDFSYLGEYSNTPSDNAIDREELGDRARGEKRYFIPANAEYAEEDYERMEDYNKSEWHMLGIQAQATIVVAGVLQKIHSGGLWGIESDSEDSYFKEVAADELEDLKSQLRELGFTDAEMDAIKVEGVI